MTECLVDFKKITSRRATSFSWKRGNVLHLDQVTLACGVHYLTTYDDHGRPVFFAYPDTTLLDNVRGCILDQNTRVKTVRPTRDSSGRLETRVETILPSTNTTLEYVMIPPVARQPSMFYIEQITRTHEQTPEGEAYEKKITLHVEEGNGKKQVVCVEVTYNERYTLAIRFNPHGTVSDLTVKKETDTPAPVWTNSAEPGTYHVEEAKAREIFQKEFNQEISEVRLPKERAFQELMKTIREKRPYLPHFTKK